MLAILALMVQPLPAAIAPGFDWQSAAPEQQGLSSRALAAIRELAESATKAFLAVRNDRLVYEWYSPDHSPTKKHYTASMAKAIVGGMSVAVALTDGRLTFEDRVAKYVPQGAADPRKSRITIRHLGRTRPGWTMPRRTAMGTVEHGVFHRAMGCRPRRYQLISDELDERGRPDGSSGVLGRRCVLGAPGDDRAAGTAIRRRT
jgi:CubicO group peptidase (beta-lactamase class C family)